MKWKFQVWWPGCPIPYKSKSKSTLIASKLEVWELISKHVSVSAFWTLISYFHNKGENILIKTFAVSVFIKSKSKIIYLAQLYGT